MWPELWPQRPARPAPAARPASRCETPEGLLHRLQWTIVRPLATRFGGDERSVMRGPGMEVAEVREYQPGDDVRHIDWNVTARADRPFVREAHAERALDVWLVVDLSASVDWGTARSLKRERAIDLAAVAGPVLGRHGNRVGALLFADRPLRLIPPAAGRGHLVRVLGAIEDERRQSAWGRTDLRAALAWAREAIRRRSVVALVSDFLAPDGWQAPLGELAHRHEVVAVRLTDPREGELPNIGLVTLEDPETGSQLIVDTGDRALRERFGRAAQAQADRIRAELVRRGAEELVVSTADDLLPALTRFLDARRRQRAARRPSCALPARTPPPDPLPSRPRLVVHGETR